MRFLLALLLAAAVSCAETCPSCNSDAGQGSNFCPKCGAALAGAGKAVDAAVKEAARKREEFLASLEALKRAYEEAGNTARASEIASLIGVIENSGLEPDAGGGPSAPAAGEWKPIKEAQALFEEAKLYMSTINPVKRRMNLNIAIDKLLEILDKYAQSDRTIDAWYNLGICYQDGLVKRYDDAIKAYDKVKELDPKNTGDSRIRAAQIVDNLGRWKEAYDRYEDVIEHDGSARNREWARNRRIKLEPYIDK